MPHKLQPHIEGFSRPETGTGDSEVAFATVGVNCNRSIAAEGRVKQSTKLLRFGLEDCGVESNIC